MSSYVIATTKSWNINNAYKFCDDHKNDLFYVVTKKEELTIEFLKEIKPRYIFFPHWSWIIPREIFSTYDCVVFHMTDLPFGRGGSPLQNLLIRGIYDTKISAIKVDDGIDTGPVYFKETIDISEGNADDIFKRVSKVIFEKMIPQFLINDIIPIEQSGEIVLFKRRRPDESEIPDGLNNRQLYDFIRMLDGEGYPPAFINNSIGKIVFRDAKYIDGKIWSSVEIESEG